MILDVNAEENSAPIFDNSIWMTSAEAAIFLRKSMNAIHTAVNRGQLRCRKWRRRLYFRRSDLEKLIENSQQVGGL